MACVTRLSVQFRIHCDRILEQMTCHVDRSFTEASHFPYSRTESTDDIDQQDPDLIVTVYTMTRR